MRAVMVQEERDEVCAALQYGASFCLVEEWKDCEELGPKLKEKWVLVFAEKWKQEASHRVVYGSKHISVYEMRKKQQQHEDTRTM